MKLFSKTLLATGLLAAASSQAAVININVTDDDGTAAANFASSLFSIEASEDFNYLPALGGLTDFNVDDGTDQGSWVARSENSYINTRVGKFTLNTAGQSGAGNKEINQLMIESEETGEFGRQSLTKAQGDFWLDSNDAVKVTWDFNKPAGGYFNAVGFQLSDASDVSADLTLKFSDGTSQTITFPEDNGNLKFVKITSDMNILGGFLEFNNSTKNDGWGIDNVTLGRLPEPGTLLLMGLGLLGLGAARRRVAK